MNRADILGYDVIGDVHGHHDALTRLLDQMGYVRVGDTYRHPDRQAVFVGDLIDRGPAQVDVYRLVRAMLEAGSARLVLGNHEFNAVGYATSDTAKPGEYLRSHSEKNRRQHAEFLVGAVEGSPLHREIIAWLMTIPLWCELSLGKGTLRVAHACWHTASMDLLRSLLNPDLSLTPDVLAQGSQRGNSVYDAIEVILKGPEINMGGFKYKDPGGDLRDKARLKWWNTSGRSLRDLALIPDEGRDVEPLQSGEDVDAKYLNYIYRDDVPVLFGHYWRTGSPSLFSPTTACVDYSVAKNGHLVAYRWDVDDMKLSNDKFYQVAAIG